MLPTCWLPFLHYPTQMTKKKSFLFFCNLVCSLLFQFCCTNLQRRMSWILIHNRLSTNHSKKKKSLFLGGRNYHLTFNLLTSFCCCQIQNVVGSNPLRIIFYFTKPKLLMCISGRILDKTHPNASGFGNNKLFVHAVLCKRMKLPWINNCSWYRVAVFLCVCVRVRVSRVCSLTQWL